MTTLTLDLYIFFLYLANATITLDEDLKEEVFNNMAYKLMEWDNISRCELRKVFQEFSITFEELCANCNEELWDYNGDEEAPLCEDCNHTL